MRSVRRQCQSDMRTLLNVVFAIFVAGLLVLAPAEGGNWPDTCGNNRTHNFDFGRVTAYDRILYTNHTFKAGLFLRKQSFDLQIPPKGTYPKGVITYVQVRDQYSNGKGGCAFLKSGGPGSLNVTLHLKSQRGEGLNFIINVFGH